MAKKSCHGQHSLLKSQLNQEDKDGEQIIYEIKAFLVFPAGNKSLSVNIKFTDSSLKIEHSGIEETKRLEDEQGVDDFASDISYDELSFKNYSLAQRVEEREKVKYLNIPLGLIESIQITDLESFKNIIMIKTKDFRTVALSIMPKEDQDTFVEELKQLAFPGEINEDHFLSNFCYDHQHYFKKQLESPAKVPAKLLVDDTDSRPKLNKKVLDRLLKDTPLDENGWDVYDFNEEFKRQGITEKFRAVQ